MHILESLRGSEQFPDYLQGLFGYVDTLADLYQLLVQSGNITPAMFHLVKNGASGFHFWESVGSIMLNPKNEIEQQIRKKGEEIIVREDNHDVLLNPGYRVALRKMAEVLATDEFMKKNPDYAGQVTPIFQSILALRKT